MLMDLVIKSILVFVLSVAIHATAATAALADDGEVCIPADIEKQVLASTRSGETLDAHALYRRARSHYEAERYAEAAVLFREIAMSHSKNDIAVYATNLYLDCLNAMGSLVEEPRRACYDDMAAAVDLFIDESKPPGVNLMRDEELRCQIRALKVGLIRKKAEALTERRRFVESADLYITIERDFADACDDRTMCAVLYNIAVNLEAENLLGRAIQVRKRLIERFPNCEHAKRASYFIAQDYDAMQMHQQAADYYIAFARKFAGERESPGALEKAVTLLVALGQHKRAFETVALFEKYYRTRRPQKSATLFFDIGQIHIDNQDWKAVREHYERYLQFYTRAKQIDELVQAHVHIGDSYRLKRRPKWNKTREHYARALVIFDRYATRIVVEKHRREKMHAAAAKARGYLAVENQEADLGHR